MPEWESSLPHVDMLALPVSTLKGRMALPIKVGQIKIPQGLVAVFAAALALPALGLIAGRLGPAKHGPTPKAPTPA